MNSRQEPFPDHVDTGLFFEGGSRRDIVDQIKTALSEDVVLMTLTGTEGSGKTMVCRVVQQELSGTNEVVFFDQGVDSFDDVVSRIAAQAGLQEPAEGDDRRIRMEKAVGKLSDSGRRLIMIIDSAEEIFLATLERIRRMLDEVNGDRLCLQLLFSGGPLLSLNYKQLAIIDFEAVEEKHFSLDPLDGEQTFEYLNYCLEQGGSPEMEKFTRAQAENIADVARGNFRLINQLGGRYFDSDRAVDLDESEIEELYSGVSMTAENGAYEKISAGLKNVDLDFLKVPRLGTGWYLAGGGLIVLILLFLLFSGGEEEPEDLPGAADVPELTLEKVEPDPIEIPEPSTPPVPAAETVSEEASGKLAEDASSPGDAQRVETAAVDTAGDDDTPILAPENQPAAEEQRDEPVSPEARPAAADQRDSVESEPAAVAEAAPVDTEPAAVAETAPVDTEPAAVAETAPVDTEPATVAGETSADTEPAAGVAEKESADSASPETENESEAAAEPIESIVSVPGNQEPITENSPAAGDSPTGEFLAAFPREQDAAAEKTPPGPVLQGGDAADNGGTESLRIPQLTVVPRDLPATESVPFEVITLNQASKVKPEEAPAPPVSQTREDESGPEPEPVANQQPQGGSSPGAAEVAQPSSQPAETAPVRVGKTGTAVPSAQRSSAPARNPDTYYAERLAAGSRWLVGGSAKKYTVQLMVLNADDAQANVREMLVEDGYQSIMDKLYILRKSGQPQTVMLYYGEFDSSAEARQAKDQLPSFLNRLEPYELAVKEAVAKARAGQ